MFAHVQRGTALQKPKKGISARVLVDGFSPGAPKDVFQLDFSHWMVANYLLERQRGFWRIIQTAQFPSSEFITLGSRPENINQYRLAFGLTLLEDARGAPSRMGLKLLMEGGRSAMVRVRAEEPPSCIRFLEFMEGVDDLTVKFHYRGPAATVRGTIDI